MRRRDRRRAMCQRGIYCLEKSGILSGNGPRENFFVFFFFLFREQRSYIF